MCSGICWPVIDRQQGKWFPAKYAQGGDKSVSGLYAYELFTGLGWIIGDGSYNIFKLVGIILWDL